MYMPILINGIGHLSLTPIGSVAGKTAFETTLTPCQTPNFTKHFYPRKCIFPLNQPDTFYPMKNRPTFLPLIFLLILLGCEPAQTDAPDATETATSQEDGFVSVFNGTDLTGWTGAVDGYGVQDGNLVCLKEGGGNLYIDKEYSDFVLRFEFKLEADGNNGLGIRAEQGKDAAYYGMELQILDNTAEMYAELEPWQYHGSIYGVVAAERGHLNPLGEWNAQEVIADGNDITVILNGVTIVDANLQEAAGQGTVDEKEHPGLFNESGYIGFLGHGHRVEFRNIRIKEL